MNKLILADHLRTLRRDRESNRGRTRHICCKYLLRHKSADRSSIAIIHYFHPNTEKGCTLHSRFKTNWLWWCLNYVPSSCKTLPWHGDVISCGPAETPLPYFLLPCTLNRSALRNVPRRLCSRACIIWPQNSLFPTSKHYLPRTSVKPDKDLAICQCRSPQTGCD